MQYSAKIFHLCLAIGLPIFLAGCAGGEDARLSLNEHNLNTGDFIDTDPPQLETLQPVSGVFGDYLAARHARVVHDHATAAGVLYHLWSKDRKNALIGFDVLDSAMKSGRFEMALEVANDLRDLGVQPITPNKQNAQTILLTMEHIQQGRHTAAIREVQGSLVDLGAAQYIKPILLAWAYVGQGNHDKARAVLQNDTNLNAIRNVYMLNIVYIAMLENNFNRAAVDLKALMDRLDRSPPAIIELYAQLLLWSDGEIAAQSYLRTLNDTPRRNRLADSLRESNPPNPAEYQLTSPAFALSEGLNEISKLIRDEIPNTGLFYAQVSSYLNPSNQSALLLIGDILFDLERYDEALLTLSKISNPKSPVYRDALTLAAETEQRMKRPQAAIKRLERAIKQFPKDIDILFELGQVYQHEEDYNNAIKIYDRVITARPATTPHWRDFYFRGIAYERSQKWDMAEANFEQALEIEPNNSYVLNYLGYSWIDQRKNIPRALKMLEQAVALNPNNAYIIDSYGWALYRIEQFEEAAHHLERALIMEPSEAIINDHLGDVYWHLDRKTEAKYQWQRALTLELDTEEERTITEEKLAGKRTPKP